MITKKLLPSPDCYVQFTEEEMAELNINTKDKFSVKVKDGGILLEKFVPIDIDFNEFSKETLIMLIEDSIVNDTTISETISNVLKEIIESKDEFVEG